MGITVWSGTAPEVCDVCTLPLRNEFYDAKIPGKSWANLCEWCFDKFYCQLGVGHGQHYRKQADGKFACVAGGRFNKKDSV